MQFPVIIPVGIGKLVSGLSQVLRIGSGLTWPGEIGLYLRPKIASFFVRQLRRGVVLVAGTNGKTTTSLMVKKILEIEGLSVVHNASGANLLNGIVSAFIQKADWLGRVKADWGVFEVDENSLPEVIKFIKFIKLKVIVVLLNLFRDQLDRYGEVDVIVEKWEKAMKMLEAHESRETTYILNADDPAIAYLGRIAKGKVIYFGVDDKREYLKFPEHATDSIFCLSCGGRLVYDGVYYSHIGLWRCSQCEAKRPAPDVSSWSSPLPGLYNRYNTLAAVSAAKTLGITNEVIKKSLADFTPAFGRQEEFVVSGKKVKIFLSKNPAGFNMSLSTVLEQGAKNLLLVLNDRIPDGRDVSWIWDVDFEVLSHDEYKIIVSGGRVYDLALRLKYALERKKPACRQGREKGKRKKFSVEPDLVKAVHLAVETTPKGKTLFVLPTYSTMLEIRKILTGRKIL